MKIWIIALGLCLFVLPATPVMAHSVFPGSPLGGWVDGFFHPWLGLDHLLAMLAVGLVSIGIRGKAVWQLPLCFLLSLLVGGLLGISGLEMNLVETWIAFSVLLLGVALAVGKRYPPLLAALLIGAMGLFHGHAHGVEMPALAEPVPYFAGFIAATALIQFTGVIVGNFLQQRPAGVTALRLSGAAISLTGLLLLCGIL